MANDACVLLTERPWDCGVANDGSQGCHMQVLAAPSRGKTEDQNENRRVVIGVIA